MSFTYKEGQAPKVMIPDKLHLSGESPESILAARFNKLANFDPSLMLQSKKNRFPLNKTGKEVAVIIFKAIDQLPEEDLRTAIDERRLGLRQDIKAIKQQLRGDLTKKWKEAGRKKRGHLTEFNQELNQRCQECQPYLFCQLESRILTRLGQLKETEARDRVKKSLTENEVVSFQQEIAARGKKPINIALAREALTSKVRKQEKEMLELGVSEAAVTARRAKIMEDKWGNVSRYQVRQEVIGEAERLKRLRERGIEPIAKKAPVQRISTLRLTRLRAGDAFTDISRRLVRLPQNAAAILVFLALQYGQPIKNLIENLNLNLPAVGWRMPRVEAGSDERPQLVFLDGKRVDFGDHRFSPEPTLATIINEKVDLTAALKSHLDKPVIRFVDQDTGRVYGEYYSSLNLTIDNLPAQLSRYLTGVEGKINQPPLEFLAKIGYRSARHLLTSNGVISGASDPSIQLVEMVGGNYNQFLLNSENPSGFHHPEAYSQEYLWQLIKTAIRQEEIPQELKTEFNFSPASSLKGEFLMPDSPNNIVRLLCAKMESYLTARELAEKYGQETLLTAYVNFVPLGATSEGLPIVGLPSASLYYFGKPLDKLNQAQTLTLVGMIQSPVGYSSKEAAVNRAKTLVFLLEKKGQLGVEEKEEIRQQLEGLNFIGQLPEQFKNQWIDDLEVIPPAIRSELYRILEEIRAGRTPASAQFQPGVITISLTPPEWPAVTPLSNQDNSLMNLTPHQVEGPALQKETQALIDSIITRKGNNWQINLGKKQIVLPNFSQGQEDKPGIAVAVFDATRNLALGKYDQTAILGESPTLTGSTMKGLVAAFFRYQEIVGLETKVDNRPGNYALVHDVLPVINSANSLNSDSEKNALNLRQALAYSANVYFQKVMKEYLKTNPNGWQEFQGFLSRFGMELCDIYGNRLDQPTDYAVIGSDAYVINLSSFAKAYGMLAAPDLYFPDDPKLIKACQEVTSALADQKLKAALTSGGGNVWGVNLPNFQPETPQGQVFFKTGTVTVSYTDKAGRLQGGKKTSDLFAVGVIRTSDGRTISVATRIAGQRDNLPVNLIGGDSGSVPLPITRWLLEQVAAVKTQALNISAPEKAVSDLMSMRETEASIDNYGVQAVTADCPVFDRFGNQTYLLTSNDRVDVIGQPQNGLQEVAVCLPDKDVFTGFIDSRFLVGQGSVRERGRYQNADTNLRKIRQALALASPDFSHPSLNFVFVGPDETSASLSLVYQNLQTRHQLMAGTEDFGGWPERIGFVGNNQVFVNSELLRQFLGDNDVNLKQLTFPQQTLQEIILYQENIAKINQVFTAAGSETSLDKVFWQGGQETPAQRLISSLIRYRYGIEIGNGDSQIKQTGDLVKYYPERIGSRLARIYKLFDQLMLDLDNYNPLKQESSQEFIQLLTDLNQTPTSQERMVLEIK